MDESDLQHDRAVAGTDDHDEALLELEDPDRVSVGMKHVLVGHAVLTGTVRDDRFGTH